MKVRDTDRHWIVRCKMCGTHYIPKSSDENKTWYFNGNVNCPTFVPSIKEITNDPTHPHYQPRALTSICHFTITNGTMQYHGDCTHEMANTSEELLTFDGDFV